MKNKSQQFNIELNFHFHMEGVNLKLSKLAFSLHSLGCVAKVVFVDSELKRCFCMYKCVYLFQSNIYAELYGYRRGLEQTRRSFYFTNCKIGLKLNHAYFYIFRVISRAPGLKLVVQTLLSSLRPIGNIVLICCTFFIIFGILGVQVIKSNNIMKVERHFYLS